MRQYALLLLAVVAYACEQAPMDVIAPDGQAVFKKGGGGGKPSDNPLEVEIHDNLGLLHSDGLGLYVDGVGSIVATLGGRSGYFKLDLYESARTYHVHLADGEIDPDNPVCGNEGPAGSVDCWEEGEVGHGDIGYGRLNTISSPEGGLLALMPDQTEEKYLGFAAIGMPIGRLTWGKGCDNKDLEADFVNVTAFDDDANGEVDRWTIEAPFDQDDPDGNSVLCRCATRGNKEDTCTVGRFNLPFELTLRRLP